MDEASIVFDFFEVTLEIDQVPQSVIEDAAQLVKANSIQGNKMNDVDVVSYNLPKLWLSIYCAL